MTTVLTKATKWKERATYERMWSNGKPLLRHGSNAEVSCTNRPLPALVKMHGITQNFAVSKPLLDSSATRLSRTGTLPFSKTENQEQ